MRHVFLLALAAALSAGSAMAQMTTVKGEVVIFDSVRVANVEVSAKKLQSSTTTDSLGRFLLSTLEKDYIVVNHEVFGSTKVKVDPKHQGNYRINLSSNITEDKLDMAVGYGFISEKDKLYAVECIKNGEDFSIYENIYELVRSKAAGASVNGDCIVVRGGSSYSNDCCALLIVDGVPMNSISHISPTFVKSISVLKDGSAAVYGTQGANGVVIITTKRGGE